jgi:hypothetical protein
MHSVASRHNVELDLVLRTSGFSSPTLTIGHAAIFGLAQATDTNLSASLDTGTHRLGSPDAPT